MEACKFYPGKPKEIVTTGTVFTDKSLDPNWVAEPKWNGWRLFAQSNAQGVVTAFNSKGGRLSHFEKEGLIIPPNTFIDCEWVDRRTTTVKNKIVVFGILQYENQILEGKEEANQRRILEMLFKNNQISSDYHDIQLVERFNENFLDHFNRLRDEKIIEGLVLKKLNAPIEMKCNAQFKSARQLKVKY
jgi:ATP-dependent DNA ligase